MPPETSPGFRGPYDYFLSLQESRYGRDEDGEVIIVDTYAGEASDVEDYYTDADDEREV